MSGRRIYSGMAQSESTPTADEPVDVAVFYTRFGDHTENDTAALGRELRHEYQFADDRDTITDDEFEQAYRHVATDTARSLEDVWHQWNASGKPSMAFRAAETRSMVASDVVRFDGKAFICASIGWERAEHLDDVTADAVDSDGDMLAGGEAE